MENKDLLVEIRKNPLMIKDIENPSEEIQLRGY